MMIKFLKYAFITASIFAVGFGLFTEMTKPSEPKATKAKTETVSVQKNKQAKINYRTQSSRVLAKYYDVLAKKAGMGVPDIDESIMNFEERDIASGLRMTKNTFTLAGNDKITHNYTMMFRKKTGEITRIQIDGKQVFYNEALQTQAMEDK